MYQAWDPVVRRDVAIKVLTSVSDPSMLARFRSEAGTTGFLKHKNIITIYDFGEHDSAPYLVMELLEGRSLREAIETGPRLSLLEKLTILGEIARGLLHAHQHGVIHRDAKPANIMLLADGAVKILDFGIARMVDRNLTRHTGTGMMVGTVEYMSPELFEGEDATASSDIFSYGVVCYELLSGKQPFRASHPMAVINLVSTKVPEPLRTLAPDCPEALESIVQMAMAKRCSERYQTLQHLLFDLAPIEAGLRKNRADSMAAEAQQALETGDLDSAQTLVWRALELDPTNPPSQELWRRIQRQRERLVLEERFQGALQEVESLLRRQSFVEAIQALEAMRSWLGSDSVGDLRANLEARLSAAREARERAQRIGALLDEAQEAAGRHDLVAASRGAALVLSLDSGNTVALGLQRWVAVETERARVEAEKAERERQRREELWMVEQGVREHIADHRFDDASRLIEDTLQRYPGDRDLLGLQSLVDTARQTARQQAAEALRAEEERQVRQAQASNCAPAAEGLPTQEVNGPSEPQVGAVAAGGFVRQPETAAETPERLSDNPGTQAEAPAPPQQVLHSQPQQVLQSTSQEFLQSPPQQVLHSPRQEVLQSHSKKKRWGRRFRLPRPLAGASFSQRWILAAAAGTLLLVVGLSGILWRQHYLRRSPGPSAGTPPITSSAPRAAPDFTKRSMTVHSVPVLPDPPPVRRPAASPSQLPAFLLGTRVPDPPPAPTKAVVVEPALRAGATKVNPKDGLTYVWIPPGTFQMGCSPGDSECDNSEKLAHQVTITKGFWIGQTEVTQEAWEKVMGTNPSNIFKGAKLPVQNITWNDARSYCQTAGMRLPTEAEWEYAARAGSRGSRYGNLDGIAWHRGNSGMKPHEVGGKQPNVWGLFDMLGNVWEWVEDWFDFYPTGDATDPPGPASGTNRSTRGGSWHILGDSPRASDRRTTAPDHHNYSIGCRCGGN